MSLRARVDPSTLAAPICNYCGTTIEDDEEPCDALPGQRRCAP